MSETLSDFMHREVGHNWVVARRTKRIIAKYGDNVITLTPKRYSTLVAQFELSNLMKSPAPRGDSNT